MRRVVQVRAGKLEKIFQAEANNLHLLSGKQCIVESDRELEFGEVLSEPKMILEAEVPKSLRRVVRIATSEDMKQQEENKKKEREAFQTCVRKITERNLPMKLVLVEIPFSRNRITFYFTAEERVDFRELIKDLAHVFRTRIEMRQIGVRDEAKMLGGIGCCGRALCCATFLKSFEPVGIRMAQNQRLSLNPDKISGLCGRLMCCLAFEHELYREMRRSLPKEGTEVATEKGLGKVTGLNVLKQTVTVELEDGQEAELPAGNLVRTWWGGRRESRRKK
jgi:cell fate regulator YaaT (PSP1 superfamily)